MPQLVVYFWKERPTWPMKNIGQWYKRDISHIIGCVEQGVTDTVDCFHSVPLHPPVESGRGAQDPGVWLLVGQIKDWTHGFRLIQILTFEMASAILLAILSTPSFTLLSTFPVIDWKASLSPTSALYWRCPLFFTPERWSRDLKV